jgi:hypothetical protein
VGAKQSFARLSQVHGEFASPSRAWEFQSLANVGDNVQAAGTGAKAELVAPAYKWHGRTAKETRAPLAPYLPSLTALLHEIRLWLLSVPARSQLDLPEEERSCSHLIV